MVDRCMSQDPCGVIRSCTPCMEPRRVPRSSCERSKLGRGQLTGQAESLLTTNQWGRGGGYINCAISIATQFTVSQSPPPTFELQVQGRFRICYFSATIFFSNKPCPLRRSRSQMLSSAKAISRKSYVVISFFPHRLCLGS